MPAMCALVDWKTDGKWLGQSARRRFPRSAPTAPAVRCGKEPDRNDRWRSAGVRLSEINKKGCSGRKTEILRRGDWQGRPPREPLTVAVLHTSRF